MKNILSRFTHLTVILISKRFWQRQEEDKLENIKKNSLNSSGKQTKKKIKTSMKITNKKIKSWTKLGKSLLREKLKE